MQDRVVVLVHHAQFVGSQAVGLTQEPAPDPPDPDERNSQRCNGNPQDRRPLGTPVLRQGLGGNTGRHQPDYLTGLIAYRRDGADRRAQSARVNLAERFAAQCRLDGAQVLSADLTPVGVSEASPVGRHDRDERDVGVLPDRLGDRL
jgi:hypothetical protein